MTRTICSTCGRRPWVSEIMIFLLGVVIGLSGMGVTCWLLDAVGKEDEDE